MFFGTTPAVIGQYLSKVLSHLKPTRSFVPFAGNFGVEQIVGNTVAGSEIISTDVSLYSVGIGFGIMGKDFKLNLREDLVRRYPEIAADNSPMGKAVQIIFFCEVAQNMQKERVPYYRSLVADSERHQKTYALKIRQQLEKVASSLKKLDFKGIDAMEVTKTCKAGDFVYYDPPFFLGGYEAMFAPMEACFEYEPVKYTEMTDEIIFNELERLASIGCNVLYRTHNELEKVPAGYKIIFKHGYKYGAYYCIYSNADIPNSLIGIGRFDPLKEEVKNYPIISEDDEITPKSKVTILKCSGKVSNHYRLMWVHKAQRLDGGNSYLIFVDEKLIGVLQVSSGLNFGTDLASIFSDPAAPSSQYTRLSKLVIALASTKSFLAQFNEDTLWEHTGLTTRVFTDYEVSMKYRDIFELVKKEEDTSSHYKNALIYQNRDNLFTTYKAALEWWCQKHGKKTIKKA